jgi:hypothetical protein
MKQPRVTLTVVMLVAAGLFAASAFADVKPEAAQAATQVAPDAKVPVAALSTAEEKQLQVLTEQFLAERGRYQDLQRTGAPADKVETQRKQMEQTRDRMRVLRRTSCPVQAATGCGLGPVRQGRGSGPGLGGGRGAGHQGRGCGMGSGRGTDRGAGLGQGGPGGGRGMRAMCQGGSGLGRRAGVSRGAGTGRGGGMGREGRGAGAGHGWRGGRGEPDRVAPAASDAGG